MRRETAFTKAFAAALERSGLPQRGLAAMAGVSPVYVNHLYYGRRKPNVKWLGLIAAATRMDARLKAELYEAAELDLSKPLDLTKK